MSAWSIDLESANKFWWKILGGMVRINNTDIDFERMTVWLQSSCTESYIYKFNNTYPPPHCLPWWWWTWMSKVWKILLLLLTSETLKFVTAHSDAHHWSLLLMVTQNLWNYIKDITFDTILCYNSWHDKL